MTTFLVLVVVLAVVVYFVNRKVMETPKPLFKAPVVDEVVAKPVVEATVVATPKKKVAKKITGKTRKPRTKKSAE